MQSGIELQFALPVLPLFKCLKPHAWVPPCLPTPAHLRVAVCQGLRSPLHVLKSTLTTLLEDEPGSTPGRTAAPVDVPVLLQPLAVVRDEPYWQRHAMVSDVFAAVADLEGIVSVLADFQALASGRLVMHRAPVCLTEVVGSVCTRSRAFLRPSVQLGYRVSPADAVVMGDARRLAQILACGLSNAGKVTLEGAVAVDVVVVKSSTGQQYIAATVSNTSYGSGLCEPESFFVPFHETQPAASGVCGCDNVISPPVSPS